MKKTVEKIYCDDCGKEIKGQIITLELPLCKDESLYFKLVNDVKHKSYVAGTLVTGPKDFCLSCITWRVNHSITIVEDRMCTECHGRGKVKEYYGYHNDYEYKPCDQCRGIGVLT